jgi:hypothetical protein
MYAAILTSSLVIVVSERRVFAALDAHALYFTEFHRRNQEEVLFHWLNKVKRG